MTTENLSMFAAAADRVGRDHSALEAAGAEKLAEGASLLIEVIAALRGAWRAMASRVALSSTTTSAGVTTEPATWTGLYLAGDGPNQGRTKAGDGVVLAEAGKRGRYGGTRLMLRGFDGKLVQLAYSGPWSTVPGEVSSWKATEREVSAVDAVDLYGLAPILGELEKALRAQAEGRAPERARQLREEAERIRAVATLLRSSR